MDFAFLDTPDDRLAMDRCHAMAIFGAALSHKPARLLELGVGTGLVTRALLSAIEYNGVGQLTCVDNCEEFGGVLPPLFDTLVGAAIVNAQERAFLAGCADDSYDFLVSDADHSGTWVEEFFRVTTAGSICFFHDTNTPSFAGLYGIEGWARRAGYSYAHYRRSSRPDERCERGLLMVVNEKVTLYNT